MRKFEQWEERILEKRPELRDWLARRPLDATRKPKPKLQVTAELSPKVAEAVKANPASLQVRVYAEAQDGTAVVERPRRTEAIEVLEVDGEGRPKLARRHDFATNEWTTVEFDQGYRRSGVVSDYNPLDRLKRGDR